MASVTARGAAWSVWAARKGRGLTVRVRYMGRRTPAAPSHSKRRPARRFPPGRATSRKSFQPGGSVPARRHPGAVPRLPRARLRGGPGSTQGRPAAGPPPGSHPGLFQPGGFRPAAVAADGLQAGTPPGGGRSGEKMNGIDSESRPVDRPMIARWTMDHWLLLFWTSGLPWRAKMARWPSPGHGSGVRKYRRNAQSCLRRGGRGKAAALRDLPDA